jgi:hypothetical protein
MNCSEEDSWNDYFTSMSLNDSENICNQESKKMALNWVIFLPEIYTTGHRAALIHEFY